MWVCDQVRQGGTTVSGLPTWACIWACECGVEERSTKPRPLLGVDVDAERKLDEVHGWRSMVFVIEERFLWRLNGRRALTLTGDHSTVAFIRTRRRKRRTWDTPFLGSYYTLHSFLEFLSVYAHDTCVV